MSTSALPFKNYSEGTPQANRVETISAILWLVFFVGIAIVRSNFRVPKTESYALLITFGLVQARIYGWGNFKAILKEFRSLWTSAALLAGGIAVSELCAMRIFGQGHNLSTIYWIGLLGTLPLLVFFLRKPTPRDFFFGLLAVIVLWHFIAMPTEAFFGRKLTWHEKIIQFGGFLYQASGLAITRVFFVGLYLPMFYLVLGPIWEKRALPYLRTPASLAIVLAAIWVFMSMCSASREGFIAACIASYIVVWSLSRGVGMKIAFFLIPPIIFYIFRQAHVFTGQLFISYGSAIATRLDNVNAYFQESIRGLHFWIGHGSTFARDSVGLTPPRYLTHAHHDWIENAFRWGYVTLFFYFALWYCHLRIIYQNYLREGRLWPLTVFVAFFPSLMVESGFTQFEKASFFIFWIGVSAALSSRAGRSLKKSTF